MGGGGERGSESCFPRGKKNLVIVCSCVVCDKVRHPRGICACVARDTNTIRASLVLLNKASFLITPQVCVSRKSRNFSGRFRAR